MSIMKNCDFFLLKTLNSPAKVIVHIWTIFNMADVRELNKDYFVDLGLGYSPIDHCKAMFEFSVDCSAQC